MFCSFNFLFKILKLNLKDILLILNQIIQKIYIQQWEDELILLCLWNYVEKKILFIIFLFKYLYSRTNHYHKALLLFQINYYQIKIKFNIYLNYFDKKKFLLIIIKIIIFI